MEIGLADFDAKIIGVFLCESEFFGFVGFDGEIIPPEYDPHAVRFNADPVDQRLGLNAGTERSVLYPVQKNNH